MAKKIFTDESLQTLVDETKSYVDNAVSTKANSSHNHSALNITSGTLSSDRLPTVPITKGGTGATTAAGALINLGVTATAAELNKLDGVTATTTELNYVDGVTSNIQTQLDSKQAAITGGATTITSSNLTASRVLISNSSGKVAVSDITSTELGYLDGVTSNVQAQLDQLHRNIDSIPQSDWNQTDSAKLDYIKNRTHWSKTESTVISEETVDTSDYTYTFATPFVLNIGQTYVVVFDGVTYNCVAFRDNGNYNRTTIGGSYSNYSTYPFSIYVKSNGDTCITSEVNSTHTVKIINVNETIQKLDEKYIPDAFAKSADMEVMINDVEENLTDKVNKKANTSDITSGFVANVVTTLNTSNWKGVTYGNGKYVVVGDRKFAYSTDGVSWQYGTLPFYANGIAYGNGMFCAYGYSEKTVCYSTDGINWTTADTNYNSNKFSIYFLNNRFVISAGYAILSSSDCVTWSKFELGESCTLYGGAYGNGVYIMSGYGDTFTSTNGTSWTKTTSLSTTENYGSIFFVGGKFIAIAHGTTNYGSSNKIAYSTNGTSWTYGTLPISASWVEAAYCNGAFMIAGYKSLAYSNDGVNWATGSLPEGWTTIETMGSGNEFLLFEGSGNEVAIAKQNPYDLVFKEDTEWTLIYDSGEITTAVNSIANINISGYKNIQVVAQNVNDGTNTASAAGAIKFTSNNGKTYLFPAWANFFQASSGKNTAGMAHFKVLNEWLMMEHSAASASQANDIFNETEGGSAFKCTVHSGSAFIRCSNELSTMAITSQGQSTSNYFGVGSRVMVWGCKA